MPDKKRPNILWIAFEDTNPFYDCYGDPVARTPNLDRLAAEGCRWTNTFSTAGVCAPARSAIITGMYPTSIGTHHMRTGHTNRWTPELPTPYSAVVPHYVRCFTEYLRAAGYYCTNNGKTDYQFDAPLTAWDEQITKEDLRQQVRLNGVKVRRLRQWASLASKVHWRNRSASDQPFFAVFNLGRTHESRMWPEGCPKFTFDPDAIELPPYFPDTPKVREAMAHMYTNIEYNDDTLGELLRQLEEDGLADHTIVFHWSDHGPLPRGKRWPYDSGIHVPMIVRWPGHLEPGSVSEDLVSTIDLGPTVLSMAGIEIPSHMQGQAFLGPQAAPPREYIYAARDRHDEAYDMVRAVRDRRFKYIRNYHPEQPYLSWIPYRNKHPIMQEMWRLYMAGELKGPQLLMFQPNRPVEELYDTQEDPYEIHNLAEDPAHKPELERLREALDAWRREVGDMGEIPETEMVYRWYPNGQQPETAPPLFIPICEESPGTEAAPEGGTFKGPVLVQLHCATQGASIAYTFEQGDAPHWLLYTKPLRLSEGQTTLRAKAIRIGYKESKESVATFKVETPDQGSLNADTIVPCS